MSDGFSELHTLTDDAARAVARARAAGAEAAEAVVRHIASTSIGVRHGILEDASRSEDADLSITVYVGQRSASVSSADTSDEAIDRLVERAVAMARLAPENPWSGLAPADRLFTGDGRDIASYDPAGIPPVEALRAMAMEAEAAATGMAGVTNSEGGDASATHARSALVTSHGFTGASEATSYAISASVLAGSGDAMQRDYDWHSARHLSDLDSAEQVGRTAGVRAVGKLNPAMLRSGPMPVLFDPRVAGSLIGHLLSGMSGPAIARGQSYLAPHEGERLFPEAIRIEEDSLRPRGMRSKLFDGEGVATSNGFLVDAGRIGAWLCDSAAARQLGRIPTGHAASGGGVTTGNLIVHPGPDSRDALMADIVDGVLVTELMGQGVDSLTGDYSRGAAGWRIRNGTIAEPVAGFTIAGNLIALFADLRAASDIDRRMATWVPTLRTDSLTIAGA
jgi:PmbA protein